jgi:prepilin peptidase CpaA
MSVCEVAAIAIAVVASVCDLQSRRIPNALTLGATAAGLVFAAATGGFSGVGASLEGWAVAMALWLPIYALGGMGAGDVKLMAAIGIWIGPAGALHAALYAAMAGGILGLALAFARGIVRQTFHNVQLLILHWQVAGFSPHAQLTLATATSPRLAYAVPVLIGTVAATWLR